MKNALVDAVAVKYLVETHVEMYVNDYGSSNVTADSWNG